MTELYVLEGIKEEELTNLIKKNSSEFITFDYAVSNTHLTLPTNREV